MARMLGVTKRTLQRATTAELGMSPRDFVNTIRLEQATALLRDTVLTVDAVAARVGYVNGATLRGLIQRRGMCTLDSRSAIVGYYLRLLLGSPPLTYPPLDKS